VDIRKNLLNLELYKDAHVTCPDTETIIVRDFLDPALELKFEQEIESFAIRLRVSGKFTDLREPNHFLLFSGLDLDAEIKKFWNELRQLAYRDSSDGFEKRCQRAMKLIEAGVPLKRKKK
jgi:hypothetical protein